MTIANLKQLRDFQKKLIAADNNLKKKIIVCQGPGCLAAGSERIGTEFETQLRKQKIKGVTVEAVIDNATNPVGASFDGLPGRGGRFRTIFGRSPGWSSCDRAVL